MSVAGAELASSFMQLGLIDEYWLYVHPVVLGLARIGVRDDRTTYTLLYG